jgi:hypothetical protein
MTAEEKAAVEWLETLPESERVDYFRPPAGETLGMFSLKCDHERTSYGVCFRCRGAEQNGTLVVIE